MSYCDILVSANLHRPIKSNQGRRQGKSLEGAKVPRGLASSPWRIFEVSLEFTKKGVSKHCCDLSIRATQDNYYTVQWLDSAQNSSTIPQNLDFEERLTLFNVISERYRTRLIHTIFDIFWEWCKNIVDPKYISFKTAPGIIICKAMVRYKLGASSPSRSSPWHFHQFPMWFIWEKIISDNQRAKHIYPF